MDEKNQDNSSPSSAPPGPPAYTTVQAPPSQYNPWPSPTQAITFPTRGRTGRTRTSAPQYANPPPAQYANPPPALGYSRSQEQPQQRTIPFFYTRLPAQQREVWRSSRGGVPQPDANRVVINGTATYRRGNLISTRYTYADELPCLANTSLVCIFLCFFFGTPLSLLCSIPTYFFLYKANKEANVRNDIPAARNYYCFYQATSLILGFWFGMVLFAGILLGILAGTCHGQIGFITSMSQHFCTSCNRIRLTADAWKSQTMRVFLILCFFFATPLSLLCSIPAYLFIQKANKEANVHKDITAARNSYQKYKFSVAWLILWFVIFWTLAVVLTVLGGIGLFRMPA